MVPLGRRDSRSASLSGSNSNIPAPNNTFNTILSRFTNQGLDLTDLVALSGKLTSNTREKHVIFSLRASQVKI